MFPKIAFVLTLVTVYSEASVLNPQRKSNEATYSQSFVREDVPLSYKYSATHYYTPKKHENTPEEHKTSKELDEIETRGYPPLEESRDKEIQFAPVPEYSKEHTHPTVPIVYTPTTISNLHTEHAKKGYTEITSQLVLKDHNLDNIVSMQKNTQSIKPSTYRAHMNHDVKMFHSRQPVETTGIKPIMQMEHQSQTYNQQLNQLRQLKNKYQQQQQQHQQQNRQQPYQQKIHTQQHQQHQQQNHQTAQNHQQQLLHQQLQLQQLKQQQQQQHHQQQQQQHQQQSHGHINHPYEFVISTAPKGHQQHHHQQLNHPPKLISTTSEVPRHPHSVILGVTYLPKQQTLPTKSFQAIPRISYHTKMDPKPTKLGRNPPLYNNIHFKTPNLH